MIDKQQTSAGKPALTLRETFAAVTPFNRPKGFKRLEREAKAEHVARKMQKLQATSEPW